MAADEMTGCAHLAALGAICGSSVMMSFGSPAPAIAAATPASLCEAKSDSLGRVLRAGACIMPHSSASSAVASRRRIQRASQECKEPNGTRRPQKRLPIDGLLASSRSGTPMYGRLIRKGLICVHKHGSLYFILCVSDDGAGELRVLVQ